jgi:hypothetical protein
MRESVLSIVLCSSIFGSTSFLIAKHGDAAGRASLQSTRGDAKKRRVKPPINLLLVIATMA